MGAAHIELAGILNLGREMQALALAGEWASVVDIEPMYRDQLQALFVHHRDLATDVKSITMLYEIAALNEELEKLSTEARGQLGGEMRKIRRGRQVSKAYSNSANLTD